MNTKEILNTMLEVLYSNHPEVLYQEYRENEGARGYERFEALEDLDDDYLMELFTQSFDDQQILELYAEHIGEDYTCDLYYESFEQERLGEFYYDEDEDYGYISMDEDDDDLSNLGLYYNS